MDLLEQYNNLIKAKAIAKAKNDAKHAEYDAKREKLNKLIKILTSDVNEIDKDTNNIDKEINEIDKVLNGFENIINKEIDSNDESVSSDNDESVSSDNENKNIASTSSDNKSKTTLSKINVSIIPNGKSSNRKIIHGDIPNGYVLGGGRSIIGSSNIINSE